jgi:hypothetical protein
MFAGFRRCWAFASRASLALALARFKACSKSTDAVTADLATAEQKKARAPDLYRPCRGKISSARATAATRYLADWLPGLDSNQRPFD